MVKADSGERLDYPHYNRNIELETFLTIRYDNHGQAIHTHDPNQKKREKWSKREKQGWTTWFVKVKKKK